MVYSGRWVPKDTKRGWRLLEEAATAGSTRAMISLDHHLRAGTAHGHEGQPDHDEARRWLSHAAAEGNADARERLARYYPEAAEGSSN
jgi:TPR repeat protein